MHTGVWISGGTGEYLTQYGVSKVPFDKIQKQHFEKVQKRGTSTLYSFLLKSLYMCFGLTEISVI